MLKAYLISLCMMEWATPLQTTLLHNLALNNMHPHRELADDCVRLLMKAGADINATAGRFQLTALMYASKSGCCSEAVQALLQHGADALMQADGVTALHLAAAVGRTDSCELLVAKGSSLLHMKAANGRTALMRAAAAGCANTV
jgi:ankyrin repeat protein